MPYSLVLSQALLDLTKSYKFQYYILIVGNFYSYELIVLCTTTRDLSNNDIMGPVPGSFALLPKLEML